MNETYEQKIIKNIKNDIINIYNYMYDNNELELLGYPDHDILQEKLYNIQYKYEYITCEKEYSIKYYDKDKNKNKRGRIDLAYYYKGNPFILLEMDCGIKPTSIKKLLYDKNFKYKMWFCYNQYVNTEKYYEVIYNLDKNNEIIYLTANRWNGTIK